MEIRQAHLDMVDAFNGGVPALAAAMGMTENAFRNRLYECKGQKFTTEQSLAIQLLSDTTHFAEAIAVVSGGVFVKLPEVHEVCEDEILKKLNNLFSSLGTLAHEYNESTSDGEIDKKERAKLEEIGNKIHKRTQELLALTFKVFCKPEQVER